MPSSAPRTKGLHAATFESLFPGRRRPLDVATLRLTREPGPGSAAGTSRVLVPFHVEPRTGSFGPGSRLFFNADVLAPSMAFSPEVVYALERGTDGVRMGVVRASVDDSAVASSRGLGTWETNRLFAPDVLDIEDLWQWESMLGGASLSTAFALDGLDQASPETARIVVYLQGGSDAESVVDHHVRVSVNGVVVGEESFDGAVPHRVESEVPVSLLRSDANELVVLNVGDTGVSSRVFLDRFEVLYPQVGAGRAGAFDGVFSKAGTAEVTGLVSTAAVVDVTSGTWLVGYESGGVGAVPGRGSPLPGRLGGGAAFAACLFPGDNSASQEPAHSGGLRSDCPAVVPRGSAAAARPSCEPGPDDVCCVARADRVVVRRRSALGGGHSGLPVLCLARLEAALAAIRRAPRGREPRPEALRRELSALADAVPAPQDVVHLDGVGPGSGGGERRRSSPRPRHRAVTGDDGGAGAGDGREGPGLGGPGEHARRTGGARRRQPRSRGELRGRTPETSRARSSPEGTRPRSSSVRSAAATSPGPGSSTPSTRACR